MSTSLSTLASAALLAASSAGCAAEAVLDELPPDTRDVPSTCATQAGLTLETLNDFDAQQQAGFTFYANPDDSAGSVCDANGCGNYPKPGQMGHDPGSPVESPGTADTAACRSGNAVHLKGGGYTTYGPNFGWSVGAGAADAVDVSRFSGVSFWAKDGTESTQPQTVQLMLYDTSTYPVAEMPLRKCVEVVGGQLPAPGTSCYNGGHTERVLATGGAWHLYTLDFDEFKEETWGAQSPGGKPDMRRLMRVEVKLPALDSFDVWIDNIAWFTR